MYFKEHVLKVTEFMTAFEQEIPKEVTIPSKEIAEARHRWLGEENDEFLIAVAKEDKVEMVDALGDQLYVLLGTILACGAQNIIEKAFSEIHASNMSKLGSDGKPFKRPDGKVMKGPNYFKPNLKDIVNETR